MRVFNVTGTCVRHEHYMVDISGKLDEIEKLVYSRQYFTINCARQYGKTTTLLHLRWRLGKRGEYICAGITFGNVGLNDFDTGAKGEVFGTSIRRGLHISYGNPRRGYGHKKPQAQND